MKTQTLANTPARANTAPANDSEELRNTMIRPMRRLAFIMADFTEAISALDPDGLELLGKVVYGIKDTRNPTAADVRRAVKEALAEPTEPAPKAAPAIHSEENFPWENVPVPKDGALMLMTAEGGSVGDIEVTVDEYHALKDHLVGVRGYQSRQRAEMDKLMRGEVPEGYAGHEEPAEAADHLKTARDFYQAFPALVVAKEPPAELAQLLAGIA